MSMLDPVDYIMALYYFEHPFLFFNNLSMDIKFEIFFYNLNFVHVCLYVLGMCFKAPM